MFKFPFLNKKKKTITAVDIGHYSAKMIQLKDTGEKLELHRWGEIDLPLDAVQKGEIVDNSLVVSCLNDLYKEVGYKPKEIVTTVSAQNVVIRTINMPILEKDELKEAVKWEVDDILPFPIEQAAFDHIKVAENENEQELLLVAVQNKIIDNFLKPFKDDYIKVKTVNAPSMALLSILEYQNLLEKPVAIVDLGAANTRVVIGNQKTVYLARTIDIGGIAFTELFEENGVNFTKAEKEKRKRKIKAPEQELDFDLALSQTETKYNEESRMYSLAVELADEISRSLSYYRHQNHGETIDKIYVSGGGLRLEGLKDVIANEIGQELYEIDPFSKLIINDEDCREKEYELALAIGLCLSEVIAYES